MTDTTPTKTSNESTLRLVEAIITGNSSAIEQAFSAAMADRLTQAIDERESLVQEAIGAWKVETPWKKVKSKPGGERGRVANLSDKAMKKSAQQAKNAKKSMAEENIEEQAKWRQGYAASGHPAGFKHKSGEVGPLGGTFVNVPAGYDGETEKVPVQKHRDEPDQLAKRGETKISTSGKTLLRKNAQRNLKNAIIQSKGKHGPVGTLPEETVEESMPWTGGYKSASKRMKEAEKARSHQEKTTMKHIKKATAGEKAAAKDIKPGIAGYADRIAMLKSAQASGRLK